MATDVSRRFSHIPPPVPNQRGQVYASKPDFEYFEQYCIGGYHPIVIGDSFQNGRYQVVHKLGYGGYATIWLARDVKLDCYVALKVLVADSSSSECAESSNLRLLNSGNSPHPGRQFVPRLLDEFFITGPNGRHTCLVLEPARSSIAQSQDDYSLALFPVESARSVAAQLVMGLAYLHSRGMLHGDLYPGNFFVSGSPFDNIGLDELYKRHPLWKAPVTRHDGGPVEPHAPPHAVIPLYVNSHANNLIDPIIMIADYGTALILATEPNPCLHTPPSYSPPEAFFHDAITLAADVWTLGVSLYQIMGYRILFETFMGSREDVLGENISVMGLPPSRWWDKWEGRHLFFSDDGIWLQKPCDEPSFRPLHERMWDMGRGETPEACHWDYDGGELRDLENMLRSMLAWEPAERPTAEQLMKCDYMVKWGLPAWERQLARMKEGRGTEPSA